VSDLVVGGLIQYFVEMFVDFANISYLTAIANQPYLVRVCRRSERIEALSTRAPQVSARPPIDGVSARWLRRSTRTCTTNTGSRPCASFASSRRALSLATAYQMCAPSLMARPEPSGSCI
jgi:hypothetical protein